MNKIDQIAADAAQMHTDAGGSNWDQWLSIKTAVFAYRAMVPPEQFDWELLQSDYWGSTSMGTACGAMRTVVLQLAKKAGLT